MADMQIKELFALDIERPIEEVIKVDQDDAKIVHDEIAEYIVTDTIRGHYLKILRKYWETKNKPHEGIGIWVSGFFGSGKSSFAKMLGLALQNREVLGKSAADLFGKRTGDNEVQVLLKLSEIKVLRVAEVLEKELVHDLRDALVAAADATVRRDIEDHRFRGDLLGDLLEQHLDFVVAGAITKEIGS